MVEANYWQCWTRRRLTRRRLLSGALGTGAGLAAMSLVGCQNGDEGTPATPNPSPAATGTPAAQRPHFEPATSRGSTIRYYNYDAMPLDTLDPHQTQFGPLYNTHSAIFSKVLKYDDSANCVIDTDLAESIPETADQLTYIMKIRPNVRFHDTDKIRKNFPDTAGRQLTAEDVKYSIERQTNKESPRAGLYYRMSQWETVDKIELPDGPQGLTVKITTKRPTAPFVHFLADTNAFIIAKELVDEQDQMNAFEKMVGSGPFMLEKLVPLQVVHVVRNPDWFAQNDLAELGLPDRPIIDGYEALWPPEDDTVAEASFKSKQVDMTGYLDATNADRIAAATGCNITETLIAGWVNSRLLLTDSPNATTPFKDFRLRQALNITIDRNRMGQAMYQGYFKFATPVGQAITPWCLPMDELVQKPGYRFEKGEREQDLANARQMWEAAGGLDIGPVKAIYTAVPAPVKNYWPQVERDVNEVLGLELKSHMDPTGYTEIVQCLLEKRSECLFGMAYDNGWIDLDDWLYPYFHSTGPKNSFGLSDPELDRLLEAQRAEFDVEKRQQLGYEIQHYLLDKVLARLDWVSQISRTTGWNYGRNVRSMIWFGNMFHLANYWLDSSDPSFEGRPS
jgi:peptide/nickel transport system substrate-binding protein